MLGRVADTQTVDPVRTRRTRKQLPQGPLQPQRQPMEQAQRRPSLQGVPSQGGQWRNVYVCLHRESAGKLISREWFYTAVTRAREQVIVLTNKQALGVALERGEYPAGPANRKAEWLIDKMVTNDTYNHVALQVPNRAMWDTSKPLVDAMGKK